MPLPGKVSMKTSSWGREVARTGQGRGRLLGPGPRLSGANKASSVLDVAALPGVCLTLQLAWRSASLGQGMAASGSLCAAIDTFLLASVSP